VDAFQYLRRKGHGWLPLGIILPCAMGMSSYINYAIRTFFESGVSYSNSLGDCQIIPKGQRSVGFIMGVIMQIIRKNLEYQ
jgi:hypothetical protein